MVWMMDDFQTVTAVGILGEVRESIEGDQHAGRFTRCWLFET